MDVDAPRRQSTPPTVKHAVSNNNNNNHSNHSLSSENSSETDPSIVSTPQTTQNGGSPLPSAAHSRTQSHAMKRFEPANPQPAEHQPLRSKATSVSHPLPINTPLTQHARAQSSVNGLATREREPAKGLQVVVPPPTQESNFFTALASQERLVLELREELKKAEEYLSKLKKQWLSQEALKRKNETRHMHKMRPLTASLASAPLRKDDVDGSSAWLYQEMEKRKALLGNAKPTQRRVFNGSRQLKALSLLSPDKGLLDEVPLSAPVDTPDAARPSALLARSFTSPDLAEQVAHEQFVNNAHIRTQSGIPDEVRENFIRSSKQIATDFREGLWTFFEDLRQATVGDEVRPLPNGLPTLNSNPNTTKQDLQTRRNNRRTSSPSLPSRPISQKPEPLKIETLQPVKEVKSATHSPSFLKEDDAADEAPRSGGRGEKKRSPIGSSSVNKSPSSTSNKSPTSSIHKNHKTPQKAALHTRIYSIDEWGTWNTPSPRGGSTPGSTDHRASQMPPNTSRTSVTRPPNYGSMPSLANGPGDEVIYNSTVLNGDHPHQVQAAAQGFNDDASMTKSIATPNTFASPTPKRLSVLTKPSSDSLRSNIPKRTPLFKESSSESLRSSKSGENKSPTSKSAQRSAGTRRTASHMIDEWERTISMSGSPTSTLLEQGTPPMVARTPSPRYRA